jgi:cell division protein FtsQ
MVKGLGKLFGGSKDAPRTAKPVKPAKGGNVRRSSKPDSDGFWDRPVLMNLMSDLLLLGGSVLLAWTAVNALQRLPVFPLKHLVVSYSPEQVSRAQLEHTARTALNGNFFTVDLDATREAFERLPWVRRADVRRRWPDTVELALEEHRAVAKWPALAGEQRLVNDHGEVFVASSGEALPSFAGPEGSAARVLERYTDFTQGFAVIDRHPVAVTLSPREAWQLRLNDGVLIELGRDQPKHPLAERIERFTTHYSAARSRFKTALGVIDMRYPNGFALRPGGTS